MTDLAPRLAERVIDRRASLTARTIVRLLCRFTVDLATEIHGPEVTLEQAEELLDEALEAIKSRGER